MSTEPFSQDLITVRGAREHNLKNINVDIPRDQLVVITGLSGSGKSSLAFDTIYAEGQRRFMESLSAYARQFMGVLERPDVDYIDGLSPVISIDQKTTSRNPRSTVGTITEIYDFLRLLFARIGEASCYQCGRPVLRQTSDQIIDRILQDYHNKKILILAPVVRGRKGHYRELFEKFSRDGFTRVRVDGEMQELTPGLKADRYKIHDIELVVDRLSVSETGVRFRLADSIEKALDLGGGNLIIHEADSKSDSFLSLHYSCSHCNISYEEPAPNLFSFNSPYGACPRCEGLGTMHEIDRQAVIPDAGLTINEEAIAPLGKVRPIYAFQVIEGLASHYGFTLDTPIRSIPAEALDIILSGGKNKKVPVRINGRVYQQRWDGVYKMITQAYYESSSDDIKEWAEAFLKDTVCPDCNGSRLKKESLAIRIGGKNIYELSVMDLGGFFRQMDSLTLTKRQLEIGHQVIKEIRDRTRFLLDVGLGYLTLERSAKTLSGGEAQRIRLASQIGSQLVGVLYILDEPSIGLHQRDNHKLIDSLKSLRDLGNSVVVIEHDKDMIRESDFVIDIGPGAGEHGGHVIDQAPPARLNPDNLTASYLTGRKRIRVPDERRPGNGKYIRLTGATGHNLRSVHLSLPLGMLVGITGVSGSGKSSLINETLYPILSRHFFRSKAQPLPYETIEGLQHIDKVIDIDQSPIGRTPRSNPATYTGLFAPIRDLFTNLPESKIRGYKAGRFSFNVKGGRCETCEGDGIRKIQMNFLPDVYVPCETCKGKRYNHETLEVLYKGKSIADVLGMTVEDALSFFDAVPAIRRKLKTLHEVGMGYIRLGQQATTLSGGEAQRVKLSTELSRVSTGNTLYILDEPTTGLHFEDIRMLLEVLNDLVNRGNTVVVIEHNLDVIKVCDWLIDLGPEGGQGGGLILSEGTPETVASQKGSHTGKYLSLELKESRL
ncbi:MAG: excinuclease ABC subunit UvrA [Bacteroidetes bacterium]|nr:excinuclease ABC subunit UvrA [Bacteroidota bacterium]